jgi:PilZ domain-containing protein
MHDLARCTLAAGGRVLDGYVAACADGILTFSAEHGVLGAFRVGNDVQILVLDEVRGEVRYSGWVSWIDATTIQVSDLELTSILQKRQVVRVSIAQLCTGVVPLPDGEDRSITFVVLDISAHGMRISTNARLMDHERIAFEFPIHDRALPLDAEVLRSQRTGGRSTHYGCRFLGLGERDSDALFRYVLHTQGAQRRGRLRP